MQLLLILKAEIIEVMNDMQGPGFMTDALIILKEEQSSPQS